MLTQYTLLLVFHTICFSRRQWLGQKDWQGSEKFFIFEKLFYFFIYLVVGKEA